MIKHYLKVAFRNLVKYKTQSVVSIIGLAIGLTCFALSVLWIRYEMTYDNFHEGADRIYLAGSNSKSGDGFSYISSSLLADYIVKNCPEVESACHIMYDEKSKLVKNKEEEFQIRQINVDSSFIKMFNIVVLAGDSRLRLDKDQIAITDKAAKRIFGDESPLGKQLILPQTTNNEEKTIVSVVKPWEGHSLYSFDILLPFHDNYADWGRYQCQTFIRVYPNSDVKALEKRLSKFEVDANTQKYSIYSPIAPLTTLRSTHPREDINVKLNHIRLFAGISVLVIICGLCNYLTILVTRIRMRKRELALRKVNGSSDGGLLILLLSELILLLAISLGIGAMLTELVLPAFKRLSQIDENTSFFYREVLAYMLGLIVVTTGIATVFIGYISRQTLVGNINHKSNLHLSGWFYKASILFQLLISLSFIFCTLVMMKQLNFLLNTKELGLERHNIGAITWSNVHFDKILDEMPDVTKRLKGFNNPIPKRVFCSYLLNNWEDKAEKDKPIEMEDERINQEFADFFGVEVLQGSMLDEKDGEEMVVINEAAVKAFGWKEPIGKKLRSKEEYTVKGVIKDIYYNAPIHPVSPTMYSMLKDKEEGDYIFKVREGTWNAVAKKLTEEARKINPNAEFRLINLEEVYDDYMKSERALSSLLGIVSFICIVISVFGIFSLVTLSCQQRRKEIAIRKVNGASVGVILNLFFKEYVLLLFISSLIAFPLGYVVMKHWLENYVKQTPIGLWVYVVIFIGMALVIFFSIIWRVWKTARQNPAEVIKTE